LQPVKKSFVILSLLLVSLFASTSVVAQCSVCTKSAQQLGEKPAKGLNKGILYLMAAPFVIVGYIGFRWWKNNRQVEAEENAGL